MLTFKNDDVDGCLWRCLVATSDYVDNNAEDSEVAMDDDVDCDVDETMVVTSHRWRRLIGVDVSWQHLIMMMMMMKQDLH